MVTDTNNLHTIRWLTEQSGIPLRTLYYHVRSGSIPAVRIDGIWVVAEHQLPDWVKVEINKLHAEKAQHDENT